MRFIKIQAEKSRICKTTNLPRMIKCVEFRVRCEAVANLKDNTR
jgi:hypothetical protein